MENKFVQPILILFFIASFFLICEAYRPANSIRPACDEFGAFARFNPYSILGEKWLIFYYWDDILDTFLFKFSAPNSMVDGYLHTYLDGHTKGAVNWNASRILMQRVVDNVTTLLVEQDDRGRYYRYQLYHDLKEGQNTIMNELQFKQLGNNKYIGIMNCNTSSIWMMARMKDVPSKNKIQDAVATLGYRGVQGKSYLYQGHSWMPIPEAEAWTVHNSHVPWVRMLY